MINPSFAGQSLSLQSVGGILSDPGAALGNLLGELTSATTCVGGVLSLIPGHNPLTDLPGVLSGVVAGLNPIVSSVRGVATSVLGDVMSVVGGVNSVVGSGLNPRELESFPLAHFEVYGELMKLFLMTDSGRIERCRTDSCCYFCDSCGG